MGCQKNLQKIIGMAAFIFLMVALCGSANAMHFDVDDKTTIDADVTVTYGAGMRVSGQDDSKLSDVNKDDGNRNFDKGDMVNNKVTVIADIDVNRGNFGFFMRPKVFYDQTYMSDNNNDSPGTNNAVAGGMISDNQEWADDVEDVHGNDAEILDIFGYANVSPWGHMLDIRVGKQVISWGESLLISNGISSGQSPVDVAAAVAIGTDLKEIWLPTEAAYLQFQVNDSISLSGYYQWKWDKSRLFEGGSFFSTSDMLDDLGAPILFDVPGLGVIPVSNRLEDDDAKDSGQFGLGTTFTVEALNQTEFGLYFINYHDKSPIFNSTAGGYYLSYTEDIKLYGASFSTEVFDVNFSGEFSYREGLGYSPTEENDYWQAQTSFVYATQFKPVSDLIALVGEVATGNTVGRDDDEFAWRYVGKLSFTWLSILQALDTTTTFSYADQPDGTNPLGVEGVSSFSIKQDFTYKFKYKASVVYENRLNSDDNFIADRDTVALVLSYTF